MHYLQASEYTHLAGEINALYHEAAVRMGFVKMATDACKVRSAG